MANVNIYDPGWIFFFIFFLTINFFLIWHHYMYHNTTGSVVKYVQQTLNKFKGAPDIARKYIQTPYGAGSNGRRGTKLEDQSPFVK